MSRQSMRSDLTVVLCSCLLFGAFLLPNLFRTLQGDEIQYLLMTHSLVTDGDLDLRNDYLEKDYLGFYPQGSSVDPRYFPAGLDAGRDLYVAGLRQGNQQQWYSIHDIGVPLLLAPGYFLGGPSGAIASLFFVALLLSWNVWALGREVSESRKIAWLGWAAVMGTAPVLLYTFQLYPEPIAALLLVYAVRKIRQAPELGWGTTLTTGLALGYLPWLHMRYAVFTTIAATVFLARTREPRRVLFLLLPLSGSAILNLVYYDRLFGQALLRTGFHEGFHWEIRGMLGLMGLLVDGHAGLLIYSPIYLLALAGLPVLWRQDRHAGLTVALLASAYLIAGLYKTWYAGWCPQPVRYLVPVLPLLGMPLASVYVNTRKGARRFCQGLWAASLVLPLIYLYEPQWTYTGLLSDLVRVHLGIDSSSFLPVLAPKVRLGGYQLLTTSYWPVVVWIGGAAAGVYFLNRQVRHSTPPTE